MIYQDYILPIDKYEEALQKVENDILSRAFSKSLPPTELLGKTKDLIAIIKDLTRNFKETMLIIKPEKTPIITQLFKDIIKPLNAYEELLLQKTNDNASKALKQLGKAMLQSTNFLNLAKQIRDEPSPVIQEILKLREVYEAKEYLASVQIPKAFQAKLNHLNEHIEMFSTSLTNLEKALNVMKTYLRNFQNKNLPSEISY